VPDKVNIQAESSPLHVQLFQCGTGAGEVSPRDQRHDPFDLSRFQRHPVFPHPLDRHP
jgi:hypothetical protein